MGIGVLCALLAGAMWGMVFIAPRALPAFSPWELALGRYLAYGAIAAIAAAPILPRIARKITRADCAGQLERNELDDCNGAAECEAAAAERVRALRIGPEVRLEVRPSRA